MGVPQGSVLSPLLFNFFVSVISSPAEIDESFADDFHAAVSHVAPSDVAEGLTAAARELCQVGRDWPFTSAVKVNCDPFHSLEQRVWQAASSHPRRVRHPSRK